MEARAKMKRNAKWVSVMLVVIIFITLVGMVYCACLMGTPDRINELYNNGGMLFWRDMDWDMSMARLCVYGVVQPAFILAAQVIALVMFRGMYKKDKSPFSPETVKAIRSIGLMIILLSALSWPIGSAAVKLLWPDKVSFPFLISINVVYLLLGIIICCLSTVFNYGHMLQKESDETL